MPLTCPQCGQAILPDHLDLARRIATCPICHAAFSIADKMGKRDTPLPATPPPQTIQVVHEGSRMRIILSWSSPLLTQLLALTALWNGAFVVVISNSFSRGFQPFDCVGILHLMVGLGLVYYSLCLLLNRTEIVISSEQLSVTHGPIPWPGHVVLPVHTITDIFCTQEVRGRGRSGRRIRYGVYAHIAEGVEQPQLVGDLENSEEALYLEAAILNQLNTYVLQREGEIVVKGA